MKRDDTRKEAANVAAIRFHTTGILHATKDIFMKCVEEDKPCILHACPLYLDLTCIGHSANLGDLTCKIQGCPLMLLLADKEDINKLYDQACHSSQNEKGGDTI